MNRPELVQTYLSAKDHHQPRLYRRVFHPDAVFSSTSPDPSFGQGHEHAGLDAIQRVFAPLSQACHNIVTLVPRPSVVDDGPIQTSDWLVGMQQRHDGQVRLAAGTYRWTFRGALASRLDVVMTWVHLTDARNGAPALDWMLDAQGPWVESLEGAPLTLPAFLVD
jgi:hypothetical protein